MSHDIADIIANPAKYGFEWGYGELHTGTGAAKTLVIKDAPHMVHTDIQKIRDTFGDAYVMDSLNGTSRRVVDQRLRVDIQDNLALRSNQDAMKRIIIGRALGARKSPTRVTVVEKLVQVFVANDGTEFTDKTECLAWNMALAAEEKIEQ